jgi:hypothetical protein
MAQATKNNKKKVDNIMAGMQSISADDPDMIEKLNLIALKVAEAQGKDVKSKMANPNFTNVDPMDELGCEGCQ